MQTQEKNFLNIAEASGIKRRDFLKYGGLGVAAALVVASGCKKDSTNNTVDPGQGNPHNGAAFSFKGGDTGILQYAHALEQLEAAFYVQVIAGSYYSSAPQTEKDILRDIQQHELCHRDFFKAALGNDAVPNLTPYFNNINFGDRNSVLTTAKAFEDLGVSAYNGAGFYLDSSDYLLLAGKIVSVEARHAAAIRDLLNSKSNDFAGDDVVDGSGLDGAQKATFVLGKAGSYITNVLDFSLLPNK